MPASILGRGDWGLIAFGLRGRRLTCENITLAKLAAFRSWAVLGNAPHDQARFWKHISGVRVARHISSQGSGSTLPSILGPGVQTCGKSLGACYTSSSQLTESHDSLSNPKPQTPKSIPNCETLGTKPTWLGDRPEDDANACLRLAAVLGGGRRHRRASTALSSLLDRSPYLHFCTRCPTQGKC